VSAYVIGESLTNYEGHRDKEGGRSHREEEGNQDCAEEQQPRSGNFERSSMFAFPIPRDGGDYFTKESPVLLTFNLLPPEPFTAGFDRHVFHLAPIQERGAFSPKRHRQQRFSALTGGGQHRSQSSKRKPLLPRLSKSLALPLSPT